MESLDLLESAHDARTVLQMEKQRLIDTVLTPAIKAQLTEIDAEFEQRETEIANAIASLEARVKADVAALGESVKSERLHAVYMKGRVAWDAKALDGYAAAYPDLLRFRSEGEPSVSIRLKK